jgi:hypothetical protein
LLTNFTITYGADSNEEYPEWIENYHLRRKIPLLKEMHDDPKTTTSKGYNILFGCLLFREPRIEELMKYIKQGANPNSDWKGYTLLHASATQKRTDLVKMFLMLGVDPSIKHGRGNVTALDCAKISKADKEMLDILEQPRWHQPEIQLRRAWLEIVLDKGKETTPGTSDDPVTKKARI